MTTQSEAILEENLIKQLVGMGSLFSSFKKGLLQQMFV